MEACKSCAVAITTVYHWTLTEKNGRYRIEADDYNLTVNLSISTAGEMEITPKARTMSPLETLEFTELLNKARIAARTFETTIEAMMD